MTLSPLLVTGGALFFVGFVLFAIALFGHGGLSRSRQFRVIGELFRGDHGRAPRIVATLGVSMVGIGACVCFAAVARSDHQRAERCRAFCGSKGYRSARIGPNSDRIREDRSTWFVACICEEGDQDPARLEVDARRPP